MIAFVDQKNHDIVSIVFSVFVHLLFNCFSRGRKGESSINCLPIFGVI